MTKNNAAPPAKKNTAGNNVVPLAATPSGGRPSDKVVAFVKDHPVIMVAGGLAVGVAVSALLPRRFTRRIAGKAFHLAELAGTTSMMVGHEANEKAHALGAGARKRAVVLSHQAEKTGGEVAHKLERYGLAAIAAAGTLGRAAARRASKLGDVAAEKAERLSEAAAEKAQHIGESAAAGSDRVVDLAGRVKKRVRS